MKQRKSATKKTSKEDKSSGKETKKITTTETKTKTTTTATAPATTTDAKKASLSNLKTRTWTSIVMIALFAAVVYMGHWACFAVVVFCLVAMFKELVTVRPRGAQTQVQLISKISNWSFFVAFAWGVTGRVLVITFGEQWLRFGVLGVLLVRYHTMITYTLYCVAFVAFVLSLRSGHLKEQFKSFAWTHMILLVVMLQVNLWEHTLFKGLFWFVLPASLVIVGLLPQPPPLALVVAHVPQDGPLHVGRRLRARPALPEAALHRARVAPRRLQLPRAPRPVPHPRLCPLCQPCRALWRLLCQRPQARLRRQGL